MQVGDGGSGTYRASGFQLIERGGHDCYTSGCGRCESESEDEGVEEKK